MTRQPCAAIFGDHSLETAPPADIRQMSTSEKSKCSRLRHFSVLSPKETSVPRERDEASATTSLTGKRRSARTSRHIAAHVAGGADDGDLEVH